MKIGRTEIRIQTIVVRINEKCVQSEERIGFFTGSFHEDNEAGGRIRRAMQVNVDVLMVLECNRSVPDCNNDSTAWNWNQTRKMRYRLWSFLRHRSQYYH
ncbi:hypothetical protein T4E_10446 [Trichinella pseudospiralis]|uniref:Uncharacterized protein n=1 Tax=Trichinella pseudospiralis TaxID=6337 RepID=A0A0V0XTT0_TRIPS|nr:hypothetical protein T4E_10446 [Trichinella pseudospiralis]